MECRVVGEKDYVILNLQDDDHYVFVLPPKQNVFVKAWKKSKFPSLELVGKRYGALFEVKNGHLVELASKPDASTTLQQLTKKHGDDNRNLAMESGAQKLTQEEIEDMKRKGASAEEIIAALVSNSATLEEKTAFSQEKWMKKKLHKYMSFFRIMTPSTANICRAFWMKDSARIDGLRWDALAWMLNAADLRSDSVPLVIDGVNGLVAGAVAERLWGGGGSRITAVYQTPAIPSHVLSFFNFPANVRDKLELVPYADFLAHVLPRAKYNSLLVAVPYAPLSLLRTIWPTLHFGSAFAVYAQFPSAFEEVYAWLRTGSLAIEVNITQIFLREYQILENRTHPDMQMLNTSGFVLTGIKVDPDVSDFTGNQKIAMERKRADESSQQQQQSGGGKGGSRANNNNKQKNNNNNNNNNKKGKNNDNKKADGKKGVEEKKQGQKREKDEKEAAATVAPVESDEKKAKIEPSVVAAVAVPSTIDQKVDEAPKQEEGQKADDPPSAEKSKKKKDKKKDKKERKEKKDKKKDKKKAKTDE